MDSEGQMAGCSKTAKITLKTLINMSSRRNSTCLLTTNEPAAQSTQCDSLLVTMGDQMSFDSKKTSRDTENNHN